MLAVKEVQLTHNNDNPITDYLLSTLRVTEIPPQTQQELRAASSGSAFCLEATIAFIDRTIEAEFNAVEPITNTLWFWSLKKRKLNAKEKRKIQVLRETLLLLFGHIADKQLYINNFSKIAVLPLTVVTPAKNQRVLSARQNITQQLNNYFNQQHKLSAPLFWSEFFDEINDLIAAYNKRKTQETIEILLRYYFSGEEGFIRRAMQFIALNTTSDGFDEVAQRINFYLCFGDYPECTTEEVYWKLFKLYLIYSELNINCWPLFRAIYLGTKDHEEWFNETAAQKQCAIAMQENNHRYFSGCMIAAKKSYEEGVKNALLQSRFLYLGGGCIGIEAVLSTTELVMLFFGGASLVMLPPGWMIGGLILTAAVIIGFGYLMANFQRYSHHEALQELRITEAYKKYRPENSENSIEEELSLDKKTKIIANGGAFVEAGLSFAGAVGLGLTIANLTTWLILGTAVTFLTLSPAIVVPVVLALAILGSVIAYGMYHGVYALDGKELQAHATLRVKEKQRKEGFFSLWQKPAFQIPQAKILPAPPASKSSSATRTFPSLQRRQLLS